VPPLFHANQPAHVPVKVEVVGARDVAGAARTCAHPAGRLDKRIENDWALALAQIIVGAPDNNAFGSRTVIASKGIFASKPFEICKDTVASLILHRRDASPKIRS
jgi:hypothetical protein